MGCKESNQTKQNKQNMLWSQCIGENFRDSSWIQDLKADILWNSV